VLDHYVQAAELSGGTWRFDDPLGLGDWAVYAVPKDRPPLDQWLQNHPDAMQGMRGQVLPDYSDHETSDPNTYPYTFSQPFPGVSLDQPPNGNQWWDDPYYFPTTDTDGDGWPDWMEERLGAKPGNAGNYPDPNADPDGDGYTNNQERQAGTDPADPNSHPSSNGDPTTDTDGDGIADSADPCPNDPTNSCNYSDPSQDQKIPTDYARESTLQDVKAAVQSAAGSLQQSNDLLQQIADNTKPKDAVTPPDYAGDQPELSQWTPAAPLESAWDSVTTHFTSTLTTLEASISDKLPFALGSWIPVLSGSTGTPSCAQIPITLLGIQTNLGWCDSVFYTFITGTVRAGVLVLLLIGFYFASARTLAWS
jgi:hypothetical protein